MKTTKLTTAMTVISLLVCLVAATTTEPTAVEEDHQAARDKKMDKMMKDMYMAFMLAKNMIGFILMFVSPIIQIKGFGLSVINTLVNIARFVLQMQTAKHMKLLLSSHHPHINSYAAADIEDRWSGVGPGQYAYYSPPPKG
ncbi:uncharacterized protein LOC124369067 isoform X1 [Homalodisca vitripennis]|uniref:uncharacterized protein LOC124369067 isoform X1 n=1 Tax=Homalodisca vitripennis TaxID=197043 RepID=UPI001EEB1B1C|nr:uncharacterized protein LOC124369067 isoform X1 [Homalodisca vitripennis]